MSESTQIQRQRTQTLVHHPALWRGSDLARPALPGVPTGFPLLDAELPGGGWPAGALTELLPAHEGIGELRFLGPALAALSARGRQLAWIAPPYLPYAPALAAAGIDPARMAIVRTRSEKDALWAAEQALASNACGAVLVWLAAARGRYAELRRLQIAAESGPALAFLFRPPELAGESSPAVLRIAISTANGGLALRLLKRRGVPLARPVLLPAMPPAQRYRLYDHGVDRRSFPQTAARDPAARVTLA